MMSPGPDMVLVMKNTLGQLSFKPAIYTVLGIALGLSLHLSISIGGLALLLTSNEIAYKTVRYIGGLYLVYIGARSLLHRSKNKMPREKSVVGINNASAFRQGLLTNVSNPKVTLYVISLFTRLIPLETPWTIKSTYALMLVFEAVVVWIIFALTLKWLTGGNRLGKATVWFDRLFGLAMLLLGVSVFWAT